MFYGHGIHARAIARCDIVMAGGVTAALSDRQRNLNEFQERSERRLPTASRIHSS
jgi:hypothetical protein